MKSRLTGLLPHFQRQVNWLLASRLETPGFSGRKFAHVVEDIAKVLKEAKAYKGEPSVLVD